MGLFCLSATALTALDFLFFSFGLLTIVHSLSLIVQSLVLLLALEPVAIVVRGQYFNYLKECSLFFLQMVNSRFISCTFKL